MRRCRCEGDGGPGSDLASGPACPGGDQERALAIPSVSSITDPIVISRINFCFCWLSLVAVGAACSQTLMELKPKPLVEDAIIKYLGGEGGNLERLVGCDDHNWRNGGFMFLAGEACPLPAGGLVERVILNVSPGIDFMLLSSSIDLLTNTYEPGYVPPSYQVMVWTKGDGWRAALGDDDKPTVLCGELVSIRTREGRKEYGFCWYGRGRGAQLGVDVVTVVDGKLKVVDTNRRDLDDFDGEDPPPAKDLDLTETTFQWEWITLSGLVNGKPWRDDDVPASKEEVEGLVSKTPPITKRDFVAWVKAKKK